MIPDDLPDPNEPPADPELSEAIDTWNGLDNIVETAKCVALFINTLTSKGVDEDSASHLAAAWMLQMMGASDD